MLKTKNIFYILTCIFMSFTCGAAVYEHIAVWPSAYAAMPQSLSMLQGKYALESAPFWKNVHPCIVILLLITLALHWKTQRKKYILISLITYSLILIVTFIYFVPELLSIIETPFNQPPDAVLQKRAGRWVSLSIVRLFAGVISAFTILLYGLTKSPNLIKKS